MGRAMTEFELPYIDGWVTMAIKAIPQQAAEEVRSMMPDRLDRMMQPLMRAIEEDVPDSSTVSAILQIEDRRARLLGIYSLSPYGENAEDPQGRAAIEHRRLIERIIADRPVLRPDEPGPRGPIH